uniref:Major sperm protein n=1 Tax=Caenorhabditis tropicalis TaxID=1561998 RepID=A0A1I7TY67_9PELO
MTTPINGDFNQDINIQGSKVPEFPKLPFVIREGKVREEFLTLHKTGKPILTTESKYILFCGLQEFNADRSCVHMELKNDTKKTYLFNIRTPVSPNFFVKPHVGMLESGQSVTLKFTFKAKCHRVPSDYCWIYSVYHIEIDENSAAFIKEDEFSSSNIRSVWNEKGRGDIENILHLSCKFDETGMKPKNECRRHTIAKKLFLNPEGEVMNEEKGEVSNTPAARGRSNRPHTNKASSETTDELPKTATSEKKLK